MKKIIIQSIFSAIVVVLLIGQPVIAGRVLPRFSSKKSTSVGSGVYSSVGISVRLRSDRRAINVYFSNLSKAKGLTYTFIYQTNGKDEGVSGSVDSSQGDSAARELLFGTCSNGVCVYHQNLSNMRLEVMTELLSGKKTIKRFRVRI